MSEAAEAQSLSFPPLYRPLSEAVPLHAAGQITQVAFSGWAAICLDDAGQVLIVHSLVPPDREPSWQTPRFMNSTVEHLARCLRLTAATVRAPRSEERDEWTDFESLSERLRTGLTTCDALALEDPDGFWATVCDDVANGDWFPAE